MKHIFKLKNAKILVFLGIIHLFLIGCSGKLPGGDARKWPANPEERVKKNLAEGKGFTLNVDLPKGSGNTELINAFKNKLKPAMEKFQPEFVLVSAGFDSHQGDLLGQLNFTDDGYENVAIILSNIAKKYASGRELYILEGGYVPENISKSAEKIIGILTKDMGD